MKLFLLLTVSVSPFLLAACAEPPLQKMVNDHKQQRLQDAYADKPVAYGSSDGVGMYSATSSHAPLTVNAAPDNDVR
jgi:hypothetical protein